MKAKPAAHRYMSPVGKEHKIEQDRFASAANIQKAMQSQFGQDNRDEHLSMTSRVTYPGWDKLNKAAAVRAKNRIARFRTSRDLKHKIARMHEKARLKAIKKLRKQNQASSAAPIDGSAHALIA